MTCITADRTSSNFLEEELYKLQRIFSVIDYREGDVAYRYFPADEIEEYVSSHYSDEECLAIINQSLISPKRITYKMPTEFPTWSEFLHHLATRILTYELNRRFGSEEDLGFFEREVEKIYHSWLLPWLQPEHPGYEDRLLYIAHEYKLRRLCERRVFKDPSLGENGKEYNPKGITPHCEFIVKRVFKYSMRECRYIIVGANELPDEYYSLTSIHHCRKIPVWDKLRDRAAVALCNGIDNKIRNLMRKWTAQEREYLKNLDPEKDEFELLERRLIEKWPHLYERWSPLDGLSEVEKRSLKEP